MLCRRSFLSFYLELFLPLLDAFMDSFAYSFIAVFSSLVQPPITFAGDLRFSSRRGGFISTVIDAGMNILRQVNEEMAMEVTVQDLGRLALITKAALQIGGIEMADEDATMNNKLESAPGFSYIMILAIGTYFPSLKRS